MGGHFWELTVNCIPLHLLRITDARAEPPTILTWVV